MLQSELDGKRVVVALGGNALGETPGEQLKLLENTSKNLAHMVKEGINVVVTHATARRSASSTRRSKWRRRTRMPRCRPCRSPIATP